MSGPSFTPWPRDGEHPYPPERTYPSVGDLARATVDAQRAKTAGLPVLTPQAEAEALRDREGGQLPRRVPGATLRGQGTASVAYEPPSLEDVARVRDALRRQLADAAIVPEIPDTPAELLAKPALEPEPEGWREWLANMAWGAARHAEPPGKDICAWCRESIAGWCDPCADAIETAAALDALHDEILTAPDMATALRLMAESGTWRTTHGETTGGGK